MYLVVPTFENINKFFVLSYKNGDERFFDEYYMPLLKIKNVSALINIFDQPVKNKQKLKVH